MGYLAMINEKARQTAYHDVLYVAREDFSCEGEGALGHPRVFLTLDKQTRRVDCPYCGRHFALSAAAKKTTSHH
jgi:uncharacterized Zn-finger protein